MQQRTLSLTARITKLNTLIAALDMIESAYPTVKLNDTGPLMEHAIESILTFRPALEASIRTLTRELFDLESQSQLPLPFPEK